MQTFFHIANASKAYSGVPALQNASLTLRHGEVHALIGENGAGKSTLIKIMAGVVSPDSAAFTLRGESVSIQSPQDALALGLRFIHQELSFVPELSVAENIFLGQVYPRIGGVLVNWRELNRQAREVLHSVGIDHIQPQVQMARLSTGDQMLVRIAAAFVDSTALDDDGERTAKVYVMDEPTAALTGAEVEMLFGVIRELKAIGDAVLYVSHRLDEIFTIADTVTVMRNGEVVTTQPVSEMTHDDMIVQMTGRELVNVYPPRETMLKDTPTLVVNNLMTPSLHGVSFTLVEGEILGVTGLRASGQTELLRALIGTDRITSGNITLNGSNIPGTTTHRWQEGITYVPRERRSEGLMMGRSVRDNMVLPHLRDLAVGGVFTDYRQERQ
ncbi:MAG: sugar ABC transporter ATP-binding protein, partial [Chloroflexota bacterium]